MSADVEQFTRGATGKLGDQFAGPILVETKFNWSHGHSTPHVVKVHGGKPGDTCFEPTPSNYRRSRRIGPGATTSTGNGASRTGDLCDG